MNKRGLMKELGTDTNMRVDMPSPATLKPRRFWVVKQIFKLSRNLFASACHSSLVYTGLTEYVPKYIIIGILERNF